MPSQLGDPVDHNAIIHYFTKAFEDIDILRPSDGPGAGNTFVDHALHGQFDPARQMPFATIVTKDYEKFDDASSLNRPGVFRLKVGVGRDAFQELCGLPLGQEDKNSPDHDYAALERLMPQPAGSVSDQRAAERVSSPKRTALPICCVRRYRPLPHLACGSLRNGNRDRVVTSIVSLRQP